MRFSRAPTPLQTRVSTLLRSSEDSSRTANAEEIRSVQETNKPWDNEYTLNFNSKNKFMLRLISLCPEAQQDTKEAVNFSADSDKILLAKGGPDVLLKRASSVLGASGEVVALTDNLKDSIVAMQSLCPSRGQRVLLLARKIIRAGDLDNKFAIQELVMNANMDLTVVRLVGILAAEAIARQCGIVTSEKVLRYDDLHSIELPVYDTHADTDARPQNALSLSGPDMMKFSEADWEQVCRFDKIVFSHTTTEQKLGIVNEFQARDECVGMTGDGVNDAPSLKQADIGIAMGSSIVDALLYARLVFINLEKSIGYLLPAGSIAELCLVLISFFFGLPQILSNLQMIFVCVLRDAISSLSLVHEQPEADLLKRKPRSVKKDRLADWKLLLHAYLFVGIPLTIISCAMGFWWMPRAGIKFSDMWLTYGAGRVQTTNPEYLNEILNQANAVYFFNLVIQQWFNLLG
ncbi:probable K, P-type ATPase (mediates high-affinity potassium or sodium uptake) [Ustilago bromivora]|uniref:Probable K, P-type ATPase (Mediates high-affinity potassium or sodium uptake) n=1 Tax=Ustilago bromivora TaxID=307758 RepID=A0A8H8TR36_9BASI|nr:probable K, P-type ATPase (mediates high-affinity potassium or sodium uptake) [Ustilago bromivora]